MPCHQKHKSRSISAKKSESRVLNMDILDYLNKKISDLNKAIK